jgi:hypothetical protein
VTKLTLVLGSNCTTDTRGITWSWIVWWQGKKGWRKEGWGVD